MNIGIDIRSLTQTRTGVGTYMVGLLSAIFSLDKENQYFLFYNQFKKEKNNFPNWKQSNVHLISTRWPNKVFSVAQASYVLSIDDFISKKTHKTIDIFYSPNLHFTSLSTNVKHILTIHDLSYKLNPTWYTKKQQIWHRMIQPQEQCHRADAIIVPSENTKQDVIDVYGIDEKKIHVVYPGVESRTSVNRRVQKQIIKKFDLPEKFVLFLGTLEPRKNIEGIIDGFKRSRIEEKGYELVIAGSSGWKSRKLFNQIKKLSHIRYLGYVTEQEKQLLYHKATAFLYPSFYEGFGLPVREALSYDTPVITSHRSSLPEVGAGQVAHVDPYNSIEIAEVLRDILEKKDKKAHHTFSTVSSVAEICTWDIAANTFIDICSTLK